MARPTTGPSKVPDMDWGTFANVPRGDMQRWLRKARLEQMHKVLCDELEAESEAWRDNTKAVVGALLDIHTNGYKGMPINKMSRLDCQKELRALWQEANEVYSETEGSSDTSTTS